MSSSAYNNNLLKTIRKPLREACDTIVSQLKEILDSERPPEKLAIEHADHLVGAAVMSGRPSLIVLTQSVRSALSEIVKAEDLGWDIIRLAEVVRPTQAMIETLMQFIDQLAEKAWRAEDADVGTESVSAFAMAMPWARLTMACDQDIPSLKQLFDPDPAFPGVRFSALKPEAMKKASAANLARMDKAVKRFLEAAGIPQGSEDDAEGSALPPGQAFRTPIPEDARDPIEPPPPRVLDSHLQTALNAVGACADWAYAIKHRRGYQGYWLAWRARVALEIKMALDSQTTDIVDLAKALADARTEMRKFASDVRRPHPRAVHGVMKGLLNPWPWTWCDLLAPLKEAASAFGLKAYREAITREYARIHAAFPDEVDKQSIAWPIQDAKIEEDSDFLDEPGARESWRRSVEDLQEAWSAHVLNMEDTKAAQNLLRALDMFMSRYVAAHHPASKVFRTALSDVQSRLRTSPTAHPTAILPEMATFLVLLEDDVERYGRWPDTWEKTVDLAARRLRYAWDLQDDILQTMDPVAWDDTRRRQKSQDAIASVARQVLDDLADVEEVFDEYLRRDRKLAGEHEDLVSSRLEQDQGVLRAIGQNTAADVLEVCRERAGVLHQSADPDPEDVRKIVSSLTAVSTFLTAFAQGNPDAKDCLVDPCQSLNVDIQADTEMSDVGATMLHEDIPAQEQEDGESESGENDDNPLEEGDKEDASESLPEEEVALDTDEGADHGMADEDFLEAHDDSSPDQSDDGNGNADDDFASVFHTEEDEAVEDLDPVMDAPDEDDRHDEEDEIDEEDVAEQGHSSKIACVLPDDETDPDQLKQIVRRWTKAAVRGEVPDSFQDRILESDIADVLFEEAVDVLASMEEAASAIEDDMPDEEYAQALVRGFHTFKGSGRMAGAYLLGALCEDAETAMRRWGAYWLKGKVEDSQEAAQAVRALMSTVKNMLDELAETGSVDTGASRWRAMQNQIQVLTFEDASDDNLREDVDTQEIADDDSLDADAWDAPENGSDDVEDTDIPLPEVVDDFEDDAIDSAQQEPLSVEDDTLPEDSRETPSASSVENEEESTATPTEEVVDPAGFAEPDAGEDDATMVAQEVADETALPPDDRMESSSKKAQSIYERAMEEGTPSALLFAQYVEACRESAAAENPWHEDFMVWLVERAENSSFEEVCPAEILRAAIRERQGKPPAPALPHAQPVLDVLARLADDVEALAGELAPMIGAGKDSDATD